MTEEERQRWLSREHEEERRGKLDRYRAFLREFEAKLRREDEGRRRAHLHFFGEEPAALY